MGMNVYVFFVFCICVTSALPTSCGSFEDLQPTCSFLAPPARSSSTRGTIIDISHTYREDLPSFEEDDGVGVVIQLVASIANGSRANQSFLKMGVHTGTHVDAPSHIFQEYFDSGDHVDTLDLYALNGFALVVDVPRDTNLTAEAMQALNIPNGVERVLFRTLNTDRRLMWKKQFDSSYVGLTTDGAEWLRDNTKIKLVGIDYLSVASYDYLIEAHVVLLQNKDIILVEGLNLDNVAVGLYELHCLPLKLLKSDGSPIRSITAVYVKDVLSCNLVATLC
ncbi:hypothetical protein GOP47_0019071 [Adiantum capillus-veneris]|uniref:Uncharacterized protein n=1 Tax=Adiantum capillus-veneris TaxID=13818 RepID=A0A9D4UEZ2_ADICA|nr:hypothetical protein GOP47_0019071 [Adiantum capillus-veneris]